jgi:hypothetical protein
MSFCAVSVWLARHIVAFKPGTPLQGKEKPAMLFAARRPITSLGERKSRPAAVTEFPRPLS